ncbi:GNAT family N-acetyltransferase [Flavobacterium sp.]|uniref:GNAT family N-acetyltransferase n=1 Tax=Flavobacterium sp. TaxID=239 RepID=UPI00286C3826|nr:GNAT family N-acetyltransferase [Flavobacterium sp.]
MLTITEATAQDFPTIQKIAYETWPITYGNILSKTQLDYMLEKFYSDETLLNNLTQKGHRFLLISDHNGVLGFASYEHHYQQNHMTRLHKLYVLSTAQGKGAGKLLLEEVERLAQENQANTVSLNVNKFNNAYTFYLKSGYEKLAEIDIPIGDGFLMEDYVMQKKL